MPPIDPSDEPAAVDGPQRNRRMSLRRKVSLKFKEFQGFVNEYSENVSTGGMFIRTPAPQPSGTVFDFEFTLGDDYTLIHGIGEVVWVREEDESFDRPAGMGVRFLSLDPDSRKLIDRMVQERLDRRRGGPAPPPPDRPWDEPAPDEAPEPAPALVWEEPEPAAEPPLAAPPPDDPEADAPARAHVGPASAGASPYAYARSYQGSGVARRQRRRRPLLLVLLGLALLVALLAAFFLFFPETAVRLLVGGEGGDEERLAEVGRPAGDDGAPEGGPVVPVPRSEAGDVLEAPPATPTPPRESGEAGPEAGDEEPELGFFAPREDSERPEDGPAAPTKAPAPPPDVPEEAASEAPAREPAETPSEAASEVASETGAPSAFTRVLNIVWEAQGEEVLVTVHLDGAIEEWDYSTARITAPPARELVRLQGIVRPFPRSEIAVGTDLLERIRVGFHPGERRSELHVVLDLATPDAELARTEAVGSELRLYLARRDG